MDKFRSTISTITLMSLLFLTMNSCKQEAANNLSGDRTETVKKHIPGTDTLYHIKINHRDNDQALEMLKYNYYQSGSTFPKDLDDLYQNYFKLEKEKHDLIAEFQYGLYHYLRTTDKKFVGFSENIQEDPIRFFQGLDPVSKANLLESIKELDSLKGFDEFSETSKNVIYTLGGDFIYMLNEKLNKDNKNPDHKLKIGFLKGQRDLVSQKISVAKKNNDESEIDRLIHDFRENMLTFKINKHGGNSIILGKTHDLSNNINRTLIEINNNRVDDEIEKIVSKLLPIEEKFLQIYGSGN